MLAYTTATGHGRGWDAFDHLVLQAVAAAPRQTFEQITRRLPEGLSYHLIRGALREACSAGLVVKAVADGVRYQATKTGQARITHQTRPGHKAAA